ncbi:uncharacterized protein LOC101707925 isoform X2 [Heterocephalus glaber]|uniref:Uncharacterized protein LOC101707925 isoform X2 n=1 Tax=Heterocephalus glaber TaxID=10181 RepID=A0AAX6T134_HETGA|nr:uncharacterized protein LOC101707925 isoform X2 [Heterocephalus glaber]
MEEEELENRRKRRTEVKRKMIILSVLLCGGFAILLWLMLKFPRKRIFGRLSEFLYILDWTEETQFGQHLEMDGWKSL